MGVFFSRLLCLVRDIICMKITYFWEHLHLYVTRVSVAVEERKQGQVWCGSPGRGVMLYL